MSIKDQFRSGVPQRQELMKPLTKSMPLFEKTIAEPLIKMADLWHTGDWFLHHDNAPAHTALSVKQFFTKNAIVHPSYSPDLAPCDLFLFSKFKRNVKEMCFATVEEVKQKSPEGLKDIPMSEFKNCFEQWKNRLEKCIVVNGECFKRD
jgi:hypothetical protein